MNRSSHDGNRKINPLQAELSHQLIAMFIQQGLEVGSHLSERDLAEKLGVSRSPIRAALKLLEHFEVVSVRPQGGVMLSMNNVELMKVDMILPESPLDQLYIGIGQDRVKGVLEETCHGSRSD